MNISVENITAVDKKITIEADSSDLGPRIDKALRKYRKQMNIPGFRPGTAPIGLIKKRIGKDVENEQIDEFVQEVFQKEIIPNHKPVGEPKMEKIDYTDGKLEVELLIGSAPDFELTDVNAMKVDKLVHDVTDEEVAKEYEFSIRRASEWDESDDAATEESKVTVDVVRLDKDGKETEDIDEDLMLDLKSEQNKEYASALVGKKKGDEATIEIKDGDEPESYKATVKKVENHTAPELDEEFFKQQSRGQSTNEEEFKSYLKSQIQNYFDQTADDLLRDKIVTQLIDTHDFEVPQNIYQDILNGRIQNLRKENGDTLPDDFNREAFEAENKDSIMKEGKWTFIVSELFEKYPDTEIQAEDVDKFFEVESAKMGLPAEMLKNFYASQSEQLEQLRMRIRTDKLFGKLIDEVEINELSRDEYEKKYSNKKEK